MPGTVHVSTTQYEFAHGCKPRGHGDWAFIVNGDIFWAAPAAYSAARAEAVRFARSVGATEIQVGS